MRLASYTGTRPGWAGWFNRAVRWWRLSPYSHTELVFSDGAAFSCSWLDDGARFKEIEFRPEHWDFIDVPSSYDEAVARANAQALVLSRTKYSLLILAAFVVPPLLRFIKPGQEVCSTAAALVLGVKDHRRFDPLGLRNYLQGQQK